MASNKNNDVSAMDELDLDDLFLGTGDDANIFDGLDIELEHEIGDLVSSTRLGADAATPALNMGDLAIEPLKDDVIAASDEQEKKKKKSKNAQELN